MRLLNEFNTAIWSILLHPLDEHGRLLRLFFELVFGLLLRDIVLELLFGAPQTLNVLFGSRLLSSLFGTDVRSFNCLKNGDIERRLPLLVQHEKMVWQVSQLSLKSKPVCFIAHQLMNGRISIRIHSIVMRVNQVALNVRECLHLDTAHLTLASARAHRRVLCPIDEFTNDKDGHDGQILGEANRREYDSHSSHSCPLESVTD